MILKERQLNKNRSNKTLKKKNKKIIWLKSLIIDKEFSKEEKYILLIKQIKDLLN